MMVYAPSLFYPSTNMVLCGPGLPNLQMGWNFLYSPSFIEVEWILLDKFSKGRFSGSSSRT